MLRVTREFRDTLYIIILSVITVDSTVGFLLTATAAITNTADCRRTWQMLYCVYFYYVIYLHTVCSEGNRLNGILIIQYIKSRGKTLGCCLRAVFNRIRRMSLGGRKVHR